MGAHLGEGGTVVNGALQCPFHLWSFNGEGTCVKIPYSKSQEAPPKSTSTKAYITKEILGMVFLWFDAEDREPQWELEEHLDVEAKVTSGEWYFGTMRQISFDQHVSEMHMNSADAYHFQTLHEPMPIPGLQWLLKCRHEITATYYANDKWHLCLFEEKMRDVLVRGILNYLELS